MKNRALLTALSHLMKNSCQLPKVLALLSPFLFFSPIAEAQSTRNPPYDLDLKWNSSDVLVSGTIENKSANAYACVRIEFWLYTRPGMLAPGELQRQLGTLPVQVRDLSPGMKRNYQQDLPYPADVKYARKTECPAALPAEDQSVTIYDRANFEGPKRSFGVGPHRLKNAAEFNDLASSIRVAPGLVVIVYEDADAGGGYGRSVDFLEDQADLSKYKFDNQISYLEVLRSERRWVRNRLSNGSFEAGHKMSSGLAQYDPNPLIAPPKPPNVATQPQPRPQPPPPPRPRPTPPPPPVVCTIMGKVTTKDSQYRTLVNRTQITLYRPDGSPTLLSARVIGGEYTILNVPVGTYQARGTGVPPYPVRMGPLGNMGPLAVALGSSMLTCHPDGFSSSVDFEIRSGEG